MRELDKLNGIGSLKLGTENHSVVVVVDLTIGEIHVYGNFPDLIHDPDVFSKLRGMQCVLTNVRLFSPLGTLEGDLGTIQVFSVRPSGGNMFSASVMNRILNKAPEYAYDHLRISPASSRVSLLLKERFITGKTKSWLEQLVSLFTKKTVSREHHEVWFKGHPRWSLAHERIAINGARIFVDAQDGTVIVSSDVAISERRLQTFRAALSLYWGAEPLHIFSCGSSNVELNLQTDEIRKGMSSVDWEDFTALFSRFVSYADNLGSSEFEKFQNSLYLFLAGKSARVYMNSRLALLFVAIESLSPLPQTASLESKIQGLFNLNDPRQPDFSNFTISNSMNMDTANSLATIRNAIVHEGIMAEHLEDYCSNLPSGSIRDRRIPIMCKDGAVQFWLFVVENLDKYFLNLIRFSGTYIESSQGFKSVRTKK